ncbi:MAG: hypothetical protein OXI87_11140 [Albidovulum sp.]|nr:hypothetical protein [Albidovulum sp.]MDE0532288.1 hypothetical protein [Albidovulum sp.]
MSSVLASGKPENIAQDQLVVEAYLGQPRLADL